MASSKGAGCPYTYAAIGNHQFIGSIDRLISPVDGIGKGFGGTVQLTAAEPGIQDGGQCGHF